MHGQCDTKAAMANQGKPKHRETTHAKQQQRTWSNRRHKMQQAPGYATMGRASRQPETLRNKTSACPMGKGTQRNLTLPNARLSRTSTHSPGSPSRFARVSAWKIRFLRK